MANYTANLTYPHIDGESQPLRLWTRETLLYFWFYELCFTPKTYSFSYLGMHIAIDLPRQSH